MRMTTLTIKWQRLVDNQGQTCDRCNATGDNVQTAALLLRQALAPLDIEVHSERSELSMAEFLAAPLESNRIWINGRPIEEWLGGAVGQSRCCKSCGEEDCRTVSLDGQLYEAIPRELVLKAGLLAAAELIIQTES